MAVCQFTFGTMLGDNLPALNVAGCTAEAETVSGTNAATTETISAASLIGHTGKLKTKRDAGALHIDLPAKAKAEHAFVLALTLAQ